MIATGGHIIIPTVVTKLLLFAVLFLAFIWRWTSTKLTHFYVLWLLVIFYLTVDAFFLLFHQHVALLDVIIGYNAYYGFLLISPLTIYLANRIDEAVVRSLLLKVFFFCSIIGAAQFLTQRPLLYTESVNGEFQILAWEAVDGTSRAFAVFTSGLGYGTFCCLIGGLCLAMLLKRESRGGWIAAYLCAAFACYTTLTRNCYTQFAFSSITVFFLSKRSPGRWIRYLPYLFLILAILIAVNGLTASDSDSAITSNLSTLMRAAEWQHYLSMYAAASFPEKMFGVGIVQNENASNGVLFPLDNEYLAILMQVGFIGMALIFWFQWKTWIWLYRHAVRTKSPLAIAIAGFWSTYLSVYFYNISIATFSLVLILAVLVKTALRWEQSLDISLVPPREV